jgi:CheY-like chemotaxis protein
VERQAMSKAHPDPDAAPQRGIETILLAEDSEALREIAHEYLESLGYTVLDASSGKGALKRSNEFEGVIHLLLTDVVMPEMDGRALAEEIVRKRPEIKLLFSSGYTDDAVARHGVLQPNVAFLQKPYRPKALARKIREVLDAGEERHAIDVATLQSHARV